MKLFPLGLRSLVNDVYKDVVKNRIFRSTVFFTIIFGVLVHFFMLSNYLFNHDSLITPYTNMDWLLVQGKWLVTPLINYKGPVVLNYLGSVVGIVDTALLAGLLCLIFSVQRKETAWLIGAVSVAFPSITTMMLYRAGDYFALAALLAVLAAYFSRRNNCLSILLGIVFLTLSIGAYQAYLGFTASILVLLCVVDLLKPETQWTTVLIRGLRYIGQLLISIGLYYGILQLRLRQTGLELSTYKGISEMGSNLAPAQLWNSTKVAFEQFWGYFFCDNLGAYSKKVAAVYTLAVCVLFLTVVLLVLKRHLYRDVLRCILLVFLLVLCLPLALNIIGVLSANQSYYYITIYPFIMLFISVPVLLQELLLLERSGKGHILQWGGALVLVVCVFTWFIKDNQCYQKVFLNDYNIQTKTTVLVTQIQSASDYTTETPVVLVGNPPYSFLTSNGTNKTFDAINTSAMGLGSAEGMIYDVGILQAYITDHAASHMVFDNMDTLSESTRSAATAMPIYPNNGSIQSMDGAIIVKLGPTE